MEWIKIKSNDNLPPYNSVGKYECLTKEGNKLILNGANAVRNHYKLGSVTHYRK